MEPATDPRAAIVLVDDKKPPLPSFALKGKKKKRGAMSFLRTALFMWRRRSSSGKKPNAAVQIEVATASAGMLNKVMGSIRPLHAQGGESPVHLPAPAQTQAHPEHVETQVLFNASPSRSEHFEDVPSPYSVSSFMTRPDASPSHSSSASDGVTSRYASALNLQELDKSDDDDSDDDNDEDRKLLEAVQEDEMIDTKAEEFIAQFYEQMRIQNYNERVRQSAYRSW